MKIENGNIVHAGIRQCLHASWSAPIDSLVH
jgi:hypothetical protein